jgi:hypothetical protein
MARLIVQYLLVIFFSQDTFLKALEVGSVLIWNRIDSRGSGLSSLKSLCCLEYLGTFHSSLNLSVTASNQLEPNRADLFDRVMCRA